MRQLPLKNSTGLPNQSRLPTLNGATHPMELLTLKQVADMLQVCVKTVRRLIKKKKIPIVTVGSQIRVPAEHVALFTTKRW